MLSISFIFQFCSFLFLFLFVCSLYFSLVSLCVVHPLSFILAKRLFVVVIYIRQKGLVDWINWNRDGNRDGDRDGDREGDTILNHYMIGRHENGEWRMKMNNWHIKFIHFALQQTKYTLKRPVSVQFQHNREKEKKKDARRCNNLIRSIKSISS